MPNPAPKAAKPTKSIFDPFNSSATGHQRADNRLSGSTSWRDSRSLKLQEQFASDAGGGKRMNDTVGAGSLDFGLDGRTENGGWVNGAKGLRSDGQSSLQETWGVIKNVAEDGDGWRPRKRTKMETEDATSVVNPYTPFRRHDGSVRETSWPSHYSAPTSSPSDLLPPAFANASPQTTPPDQKDQGNQSPMRQADEERPAELGTPKQIFANCCIYLNGSTAPLISDHKLKHLLTIHGSRLSIALGRRTVTHVVLGKINANGGSGGGLASSKIHKEIENVRGKGIKFVTAEWVLHSIKAGKRLPEGDFAAVKLASKGQRSVATMFGQMAQRPFDQHNLTSRNKR